MNPPFVKAQFQSSMTMVRACIEHATQSDDRDMGEEMFREVMRQARRLSCKFGMAIELQPVRPLDKVG